MEPPLDDSAVHVVARLEEFFAQRTPWHRRLWTVGTVLGLKEAAEYAAACIDGAVQSTEGLRFVVASCRREVDRDPGVRHLSAGLTHVLAALDVTAASKVPPHAVEQLQQLIRRAEEEYCATWQSADSGVALEYRARAIASHLLDAGFSQSHLHRWLQAVREHIAANPKKFRAIVEAPLFKRAVGALEGERLQRVPRGFAPDHPAAEYLKFRQFIGGRQFPATFATGPRFYAGLLSVFKPVAPLVGFLNEAISKT